MLEIGIKGFDSVTVSESLTAKTMGSGTLDVYATPAMTALMEKTAMESIAGCLEEGQGTVGISINIEHVSATPLGMEVRCESVLEEIAGRKLVFSVECSDDAGVIGKGVHERFIINEADFLRKVNKKSL